MSGGLLIALIVVPVILVTDAIIVGALFRAVGHTWARMGAGCPPAEPAPDAVRRNFQSFRIGLMNAGQCVHVAADARFLHLSPARLLRWAGCAPISVPWDRVRARPASGVGDRVNARLGKRRASINGVEVLGPAWCLDLAQADPPGDDPRPGPSA